MNRLLNLLLMSGCLLLASGQAAAEERRDLLIYCGITMVNPIKAIAARFETEHQVKITISQGGSEDLYDSLKGSQQGDLYLPGSSGYYKQYQADGLLGEFVHVGFNQAALIVQKGNPKGIDGRLENLERKDIAVAIGESSTGSIGMETKKILEKKGNYQKVMDNAALVATDSRNLNRALKMGEVDLILNWRATAFFQENRDQLQAVDLDQKDAEPKKLLLILLKFSKQPELARKFMDYAASEQGQAIFRENGFLDNSRHD
jgi:molybdate transport system substrate-binding protein